MLILNQNLKNNPKCLNYCNKKWYHEKLLLNSFDLNSHRTLALRSLKKKLLLMAKLIALRVERLLCRTFFIDVYQVLVSSWIEKSKIFVVALNSWFVLEIRNRIILQLTQIPSWPPLCSSVVIVHWACHYRISSLSRRLRLAALYDKNRQKWRIFTSWLSALPYNSSL